MKKSRIILVIGTICLFIFLFQNNMFAMFFANDPPSCEFEIKELKGFTVLDEGTEICTICVPTTGDPFPVYENGVLIGYLYETTEDEVDMDYVTCEAVLDSMEYCMQTTNTIEGGECDSLFLPIDSNEMNIEL